MRQGFADGIITLDNVVERMLPQKGLHAAAVRLTCCRSKAYMAVGLKFRQRVFLPSVVVEVGGRKPPLEGGFAGRPFGIEHGIPGGIAIPTFHDHMLAEDSLELKTEAEGGAAGRCIAGIALPFVAAVAQILKNVARH